jgi:hypothetical protein
MKHGMMLKLGVFAATAGLALVMGCSDSTAPYSWSGSYTLAVKFGGASGSWSGYGTLTVTSAADIQMNGVAIISPTWQADTLSWTIAAGNAGNATITFMTSSSDGYYWDVPVQGKLFQGAYQNPGEGWVDFRGIVN